MNTINSIYTMNETERHSMDDDAKSKRITGSTIFWWVLGVGIALMIAAYFTGYLTSGGPKGEKRMGSVSKGDTTMSTKSDTTIGN
jgi:hypothetical protein